MITVRPYSKKDFAYVRDICMETSWLKDSDNPVNRAYLCAMYCDYYVEYEPQRCFVAADENDIPVGYILCAADNSQYEEKMRELYLPLVKKLNGKAYFTKAADIKFDARYVRQGYTAHIHVDISESYQRCGIGSQLFAALAERLKAEQTEGIYLSCGSKNRAGINFYKKCGFEEIDFLPGCVVFGMKLGAD